jgi:hypothetical protein
MSLAEQIGGIENPPMNVVEDEARDIREVLGFSEAPPSRRFLRSDMVALLILAATAKKWKIRLWRKAKSRSEGKLCRLPPTPPGSPRSWRAANTLRGSPTFKACSMPSAPC